MQAKRAGSTPPRASAIQHACAVAAASSARARGIACPRGDVRSDVRYVVSGEPNITGGTGFVSTLSLMARFGEWPPGMQNEAARNTGMLAVV